MLGNFSFGDYFKREAIHWAWEFLTGVLKIPADRLTITVYLDDDEAYDIWNKEVRVPADRITRLGEDDNFWPRRRTHPRPRRRLRSLLGDLLPRQRPQGKSRSGTWYSPSSTGSGPGRLEPLPKKNIDTGMGLERAAACLQGVPTVFATDVFRPIVAAAAAQMGVPYDAKSADGTRIRRMADHAPGADLLHPRERQTVGREAGVCDSPFAPPRGARRLPDGPSRAGFCTRSSRWWPRR